LDREVLFLLFAGLKKTATAKTRNADAIAETRYGTLQS
jgi:hypothetical protein